MIVRLPGFGRIRVFSRFSRNGDYEYWATNDLRLQFADVKNLAKQGWKIEEYHRRIKQCCGIEKAHVRRRQSVVSHIVLSVRAFLHLEEYRIRTGISWYESKLSIIRDAVRNYLSLQLIRKVPTA